MTRGARCFGALLCCSSIACYEFHPPPDPISDPPDASVSGPAAVLFIEPAELNGALLPGVPATPIEARVRLDTFDVSDRATWTIDDPTIAEVTDQGTLLPKKIGRTIARAELDGQHAEAPLAVRLQGELFFEGTDASAVARFTSATPDPLPAALEHPASGTIYPGNLPPPELLFTNTGDSDLYRVFLSAADVVDLVLYTRTTSAAIPAAIWSELTTLVPDRSIYLTIQSTGPSGHLWSSESSVLTVTADQIEQPVIYHHTERGRLRALDIVRGEEYLLASTSRALLDDNVCTGCHTLSLDGARMSYVEPWQWGTLKYGADASFEDAILPATTQQRGTIAAFNPQEATTTPALLISVDDIPAMTSTLRLVDPEQAFDVRSNLSEVLAAIDPAIGHNIITPEWSPLGDAVVFTAYDVMVPVPDGPEGLRVLKSTLLESAVAWDALEQKFVFGPASVLVAQPMSPEHVEEQLNPAISPDGALVAYGETTLIGSSYARTVAVLRRSDRAQVLFESGEGASGPRWSPWIGQKYMWLVYSAPDPKYGRRHLWMAAVRPDTLELGAPFHVPGQEDSKSYVRPLWPEVAARRR